MRVCLLLLVLLGCLTLAPTSFAAEARTAIIGGVPSQSAYDLSVARLVLGDGSVCTGSFVTQRHLVTAAHCLVDDRGRRQSAKVAWGSSYIHSQQLVAPSSVELAPGFRMADDGFYNDLALLTLPTPLAVSVLPVAERRPPDASVAVTALGWGVTDDWSYTDRLRAVEFGLWSERGCARFLRRSGGASRKAGVWLCGGNLNKGRLPGARSVCWGDSGGPLIESGRLVGVLSWLWVSSRFTRAEQCVSSPAFYTRFSSRLSAWLSSRLAQ